MRLGISEFTKARPMQAAVASAGSFISGLGTSFSGSNGCPFKSPDRIGINKYYFVSCPAESGCSQDRRLRDFEGVRVTFWGVAAMVATALAGSLFGAVIN
ncbi:MAG: hypothetical protein R2744_02635 [Bacteroidales bacterium]